MASPIPAPVEEWEALGRYTIDEASGCWIWRQRLTQNGYPIIRTKTRRSNPRHDIYEHFVGRIPLGMHLKTTCGNKLCVNPEHLVATRLRDEFGEPTWDPEDPPWFVDPVTGCWRWSRTISRRNYPLACRLLNGKRFTCSARRAVWQDVRGKVSPRTYLKNLCGNPHCVNPNHHVEIKSLKELQNG